MNSYKDIFNQLPLAQLNTGLLFLDFEKLVSEPEYEAIGRITRAYWVIQKRYQYSQDLVRALTEAKLTAKLRSQVEAGVSIEEKIFEPEELITYYDGIFLDYIHQIKDKLLRLVWWMLQDEKNQIKFDEPDNIRKRSFLIYQAKLKEIGIEGLMSEWDQDSSTGIAIALKKRTQHHHFISKLQLNDDFQKIKMSKSMLSPNSVHLLSEYGKIKMKEIGEEAYKKWVGEVALKQSTTIELVEKNLNAVATKLIQNYKIPIDPKHYAEVANRYAENQKKLEVINQASINKIDPNLKELVDHFVDFAKEFFKGELVSIYLVGSTARGEFVPGSSDIDIMLITNLPRFEEVLEYKPPLLNVQFFSEKDFLSEKMKKYRFFCWSDGVLLFGKEIKFDPKDFPKPGTFLALLLNRGFIEKLEKIKQEVGALESKDPKVFRIYSLEAVKIMLDFSFAVAMSNKPFYTSSRNEKIKYIKETLPEGRKQTSTFESLYYKGSIRKQDFSWIIDTYLENGKRNYQRMLDVEAEIINEEANNP